VTLKFYPKVSYHKRIAQFILDHPITTLQYKMAKMEHTWACLTVMYIKLVWISTQNTQKLSSL